MTTETRPTSTRPRLLLAAALAAAVLVGLLATYYPVFDPATQQLFATNRDALDILSGAQAAEAAGTAGWWSGNWIQPTSFFYRPLASLVMYAEYRAWGRDFPKYCVVSWLVHGAICGLLLLLGWRLFRARGNAVGLALGLVTVVLFNLRRGITGVGWPPQYLLDDWRLLSFRAVHGTLDAAPGDPRPVLPFRIVYGEMPYWPAQTDLFSLLFSLASLLALDRWLVGKDGRRRPGWLALSVALFAVALLVKEMALAVVLLAPLLIWYRRGLRPWRAALLYPALGVALLVVRFLAVPQAGLPARPELLWLGYLLHYYLFTAVGGGTWWPLPAAAGMLGLLYLLHRRGISLIWWVLGSFIWLLLMAQLAGNFAYLFFPLPVLYVVVAGLFLGGLAVLIRSRSRLNWLLLALVVAVNLPVVQVKGPHYLYWPAAFWSLLSAGLLLSAVDWWRELAPRRSPPS
ncbi:MAG TPA: hypothetical protein VGM19_01645 [Armatimonadota bacterium]|jgi:hypothetical protein